MTYNKTIDFLDIERECVRRGSTCDRDCANCDIVQNDKDLITAYNSAIRKLEIAKVNPWKAFAIFEFILIGLGIIVVLLYMAHRTGNLPNTIKEIIEFVVGIFIFLMILAGHFGWGWLILGMRICDGHDI